MKSCVPILYTEELLEILRAIDVTVEYQSQKVQLRAIVVAGSGPPLMGRLANEHTTRLAKSHGQLPAV